MRKFGLVVMGALVPAMGAVAADNREWDQVKAKKLVALVMEVEKSGKRPWNHIPWRSSVAAAISEAKRTGKPLFVFFYTKQPGPPLEPCGLPGRLLRGISLSDSTVLSSIKRHFVPVKLPLESGKDFPVTWPALKKSALAFKFSNERGFAGCSVVSTDLAVEYASAGSAKLGELFDSTAYNAKAFTVMLERAAARNVEERSLRAQRRISIEERHAEVLRFRKGITRAVQAEGRAKLPPRGYSLERALELLEMAGAWEKRKAEGKKTPQD